MSYHRVQDRANQLFKLKHEGIIRGEKTGWDCLDEIYSVKKGYPLFVAGEPGAGKSEFTLELLYNLSVNYGWKHFIYMGENGEVEQIIADLCFKRVKKQFVGTSIYSMTESERTEAEMWLNEYFVFLDDSRDYSIDEFYKECKNAEDEFGIKFDTTLFDPFNDADEQLEKFGGREDKYLKQVLKDVRRVSKQNNRVDILINHIAKVPAIVDKTTGNRYLPPALPDDWSGGRTWWRRAFCMLLVYVPPVWMCDENGIPYGKNVSLIYVQKAKPKGVATKGVAKLTWDWKTNRYYENQPPQLENTYKHFQENQNNDPF